MSAALGPFLTMVLQGAACKILICRRRGLDCLQREEKTASERPFSEGFASKILQGAKHPEA